MSGVAVPALCAAEAAQYSALYVFLKVFVTLANWKLFW